MSIIIFSSAAPDQSFSTIDSARSYLLSLGFMPATNDLYTWEKYDETAVVYSLTPVPCVRAPRP